VITVRPVVTVEDIDIYLDIRARVHPQTPMPRAVVLEDRKRPDHLDLIGELDGVPAGVASVSNFGGAPEGDVAYLTIRVVPELRRHGVGTALQQRSSEHASVLGKRTFLAMVRHDDVDSLAYYGARGFEEVGRMQELVLDLPRANVEPTVPDGIEIRPASADYDSGMYQVALEADADIPAPEPITTGTFERWQQRQFGPFAIRELSFVALAGDRVVGFAIMCHHTETVVQHWMTGVARSSRGRGVALALKQAQVAAAKEAGWHELRAQNDLANAAMRRVNERLGYELRFEWVDLAGPLSA
jgi:mycothiol synthase